MTHSPTIHPTLCRSRGGCWATCSCGWKSVLYTTVSGAHLAFGQHLVTHAARLAAQRPTPAPTEES